MSSSGRLSRATASRSCSEIVKSSGCATWREDQEGSPRRCGLIVGSMGLIFAEKALYGSDAVITNPAKSGRASGSASRGMRTASCDFIFGAVRSSAVQDRSGNKRRITSGCSTPASGPLIPRMLGITAAAARSLRMAAPAWKPNGPSQSRQPARAGFCPVAARIWDKSLAFYGVARGSWYLSNYQIATFASYPSPRREIRQRCGLPREDAGACKFLAETGERCGRGAFSRMPFSAAGRGPALPSARAIPAPKGRSMADPPARLRSSGE